jgi:hypothetical protein
MSAAAAAAGLSIGMPLAASAQTQPTLACVVIPHAPRDVACGTTAPPNPTTHSYIVDMSVPLGFASNWTPPAGVPVAAGCNPGDSICDLTVPATKYDQSITVSVRLSLINHTASQAVTGFPLTLSKTAFLPAVCGTSLC